MVETWRFIQGNSGYSVSSCGRVRNNKKGNVLKIYFTKPFKRKSGTLRNRYFRVRCGKKNYVLLSMIYKTFHDICINKRIKCSLVTHFLDIKCRFHIDNITSSVWDCREEKVKNINGEEWKESPFNQGYFISNFGRVSEKSMIVKTRLQRRGKEKCGKQLMYYSGKTTRHPVKKEVALLFLNKHRHDDIGFKDRDRTNCRADNLVLFNHYAFVYRGVKKRTLHLAERKDLLNARKEIDGVVEALALISGDKTKYDNYFAKHYNDILRTLKKVAYSKKIIIDDAHDFALGAYERTAALIKEYKYTGNGTLVGFIIGVAKLDMHIHVGRNRETSIHSMNKYGEDMGLMTDYESYDSDCDWDCFN